MPNDDFFYFFFIILVFFLPSSRRRLFQDTFDAREKEDIEYFYNFSGLVNDLL